MPQFLIVMTAEGDTWDHLDTEQEQLLARYDAWVDTMKTQGVYRHGAATGRGEIVSADGSSEPVQGLRITGLFTVEVADYDQAKSLAAGCPALEHGETVVVYEMG